MSQKDDIANLTKQIRDLKNRAKRVVNPKFKEELQTLIDVLNRKRNALRRQKLKRWF